MKLFCSLLLVLSVFAAPAAFANSSEKADKAQVEAPACDCAAKECAACDKVAAEKGQACTCAAGKCDGTCKHHDKNGHSCEGVACKHSHHKKGKKG